MYDAATGLWHERTYLQQGNEVAHRAISHCFFNGMHLVGDRLSGMVYQMESPQFSNGAWLYADDNGVPIKRVRRAPHISSEQEWIYHYQMQIDAETGLGPLPPLPGPSGPRDPKLMLRWSDDGGHTWSQERTMPLGKIGEYKTRAIYRRMGRSRDRVCEISCSDPIPIRVIDSYLDASPGFQKPTERLVAQLRKGA